MQREMEGRGREGPLECVVTAKEFCHHLFAKLKCLPPRKRGHPSGKLLITHQEKLPMRISSKRSA